MKYPVDEEVIIEYELTFRQALSSCKKLGVQIPARLISLRERIMESWQKQLKN